MIRVKNDLDEKVWVLTQEDWEKLCQRLDRMEKSFSSFYEMAVYQFEACGKKIDALETEVFPKKDAKEDEKEKTVDLQIKNLQVLYSNIEEKYIKLRERIDDLETRVYTPTEGEVKRDAALESVEKDNNIPPEKSLLAKEDKEPETYTQIIVNLQHGTIELTGTMDQHRTFNQIWYNDGFESFEKWVALAIDCGLSVKKQSVK